MAQVLKRLAAAVALTCSVWPAMLAGQDVHQEGGNVYFRPAPAGDRVQVTTTGLDREPDLSPDGERIAFVRGTPGATVEGPVGEEERTELWIVGIDGSAPRLLLRGGTKRNPDDMPLASFKAPQFAPDGRSIYFLSVAAVVSDAVQTLDVETGSIRGVSPANSLLVVRKGPYTGNLVVTQHRYFIGGGSYDWVWLVDAQGKEIGPLGDPYEPGFDRRLRDVAGEGPHSAFRSGTTAPRR